MLGWPRWLLDIGWWLVGLGQGWDWCRTKAALVVTARPLAEPKMSEAHYRISAAETSAIFKVSSKGVKRHHCPQPLSSRRLSSIKYAVTALWEKRAMLRDTAQRGVCSIGPYSLSLTRSGRTFRRVLSGGFRGRLLFAPWLVLMDSVKEWVSVSSEANPY